MFTVTLGRSAGIVFKVTNKEVECTSLYQRILSQSVFHQMQKVHSPFCVSGYVKFIFDLMMMSNVKKDSQKLGDKYSIWCMFV